MYTVYIYHSASTLEPVTGFNIVADQCKCCVSERKVCHQHKSSVSKQSLGNANLVCRYTIFFILYLGYLPCPSLYNSTCDFIFCFSPVLDNSCSALLMLPFVPL